MASHFRDKYESKTVSTESKGQNKRAWMIWATLGLKHCVPIENRPVVAKGKGGRERDELGVWGWQTQTIIFRIDKQQGPTV